MITRRPIVIINGKIDGGITRLCFSASACFKELGWRVCGIASLGYFHEGRKAAIDAQDLHSGERPRLTELQNSDEIESNANMIRSYGESFVDASSA